MTAAPFKPPLTGMAETLIDVPLFLGDVRKAASESQSPGPFLFNAWNHWRWADLPLWRDLSLAPRHQIACAYCIVGRSPVKQPGFFLPAGPQLRVARVLGCRWVSGAGHVLPPSGYSRKTDPS